MVYTYLDGIRDVIPSVNGSENYLKTEDCGYTFVCATSVVVSDAVIARKRLVTKYYHATGHSIVESHDLPKPWGWCYADEEVLNFIGNQTIHLQASSGAS